MAWIAAALGVIGVALAIWARVTLGRNWSGVVTLKQDHELVTSGPYAMVRHPIYTALVLMFLGFSLLFDSVSAWLGLAFICYSFWIKLKQEEALMGRGDIAMSEHRGSCHCGKVRLTLRDEPTEVGECNCSLCRRIGGLWHYCRPDQVSVEGEEVAYRQGDCSLDTWHCPSCGCTTHWTALDPHYERMSVLTSGRKSARPNLSTC